LYPLLHIAMVVGLLEPSNLFSSLLFLHNPTMGGGERGKENHKLEGEKGAKRIISWRLQKKLCTL
jgi:hypothetical protein